MAEPITMQELADASEDAQSLTLFVNADASTQVPRRLAGAIETLQYWRDYMASLAKGKDGVDATITSLTVSTGAAGSQASVATGGTPSARTFALTIPRGEKGVDGSFTQKSYTTYALMDADKANIPANTSITVSNDTDTNKNGMYAYNGTVFTKSAYDPLTQAKTYTDNALNPLTTKEIGKNLYNPAKKITGYYIDATVGIRETTGWAISDYIPVTAGLKYTITETSRRNGAAFFSSKGNTFISGSYSSISGTQTVTAPTGALYLVINIDSTAVTGVNVQVQEGSLVSAYEPYWEKTVINNDSLPKNTASISDIDASIESYSNKREYEKLVFSKNLFNPNDLLDGYYLSSSGNIGALVLASGWRCTGFIPVIAGKTYTLSGERGRTGVSFFSTNVITTNAAIFYSNDLSMTTTVTAPAGANYAVAALYSPSGSKVYDNFMFEQSTTATTYVPYGSFFGVLSEYIIPEDQSLSDSLPSLVIAADNTAKIVTTTDDMNVSLSLSLTKASTINNSTVFNFSSDTIGDNLVRTMGDDAAPLRADNTTIGANHGYARSEISGVTHSKTVADIGSVWTDGANQWVIVDVPSTTVLSVTARNANNSLSANSLTHVSGATNTAAINTTTKTSKQWYPSIKNRTLNTLVDGKKIDASVVKTHSYSDNVAFHESYEIMAKTDIVEWLITNKGVAHTNYGAAPSILCNYSYVFDVDGGCTIYASITAYKSIPFQDWMATQSAVLNDTARLFYVPKTIAFTQDSVAYNFSALQPLATATTSSFYFDAAKNEAGATPVDRLLQLTTGVGYATGYLPLFDAEPSVRTTNASNKYLEVRNSSLKTYPRVIDSSKSTLEAGDNFSTIAYRKYFKRTNQRTAKYVVRSPIADFLYLDWHSAKTDVVELPDDLIGRNFTVHEKSSNVTVMSKFATNNVSIKIDSSKSYGYLVLRFDR